MNRRRRRGTRTGARHGGTAAGRLRRRLPRGDRGSAVIEVVLLTPLIIVLLLIAAGLGRMAHARAQVTGAARDAARAASLERTPGQAQAAGEQAARRSLGQAGVSCTAMTVSVDISDYRPGGQVSARVTCTTSMAGLGLAGFSPTKTVTDVAVVPIETFRGGGRVREPTDTVSRRLRQLRAAGERGSASLFLAVVAIAVLVAIGLVIDGGYALADRQSAANAAEQAARAGADAVNPASLRSPGPARVDPARARAAANRVLAELGRTGTVAVAGDQVTVTVTITRRTSILSVVGLTTLRVTGHATATSVPGLSSEGGS